MTDLGARTHEWYLRAEIETLYIRVSELKAENERLKAAFRVNMLRCFSDMSHEEIDAEIEHAISGEKE